jgi:hypothetical protein
MNTLTLEQAYNAAFNFLVSYYYEFHQTRYIETVAVILGSMNAAGDGYSIDRAMPDDWLRAARKIQNEANNESIFSLEDARKIFLTFLEDYYGICSDPNEDLAKVYQDLVIIIGSLKSFSSADTITQKRWEDAVQSALDITQPKIKLPPLK